jgi:hypothetical protein
VEPLLSSYFEGVILQLRKYQKLAKIQGAAEVLAIATEALREEQYQVFRQHWYQL